jgi:hypothetical protein
MYSINIPILRLVFILILLLLNSCSDRSDFGSESDYEKLGASIDNSTEEEEIL